VSRAPPTNETKVGVIGVIGEDLGQFGAIWGNLGQFGAIWGNLGQFGATWSKFKQVGWDKLLWCGLWSDGSSFLE
jgi:hypothetical protein